MGVLSRRGRGSLVPASLMAQLDQLILQVLPAHVTRSSSVSTQLDGAGDFGAFGGAGSGVTTTQLLSLLSLLCAGAGGANGARPQQQAAMLHLANLATLLPPHTFNPSSCATLLNFLLLQSVPTALPTRNWDKDIYSRVHDYVLKALWAIPPDRLVPRNRAAVAALTSCIASLAKLSRPPDAPGDKKLLIQLSTAVMEGRRSWLITPQVLATLANCQSKAGVRDVPVLRSIALAVRMSPRADIEARHCALLLNAFAQLSLVDAPLFTLLAERLLEVEHRGHTLQSMSMALHALATLGPDALEPELNRRVVAQLFRAVRQVPSGKSHLLGVALLLSSSLWLFYFNVIIIFIIIQVPIEKLHPLGVALVFNAVTKLADARGDELHAASSALGADPEEAQEGGAGGRWLLGDVQDLETLDHLLRGVRMWPGVPPPVGRSGGSVAGEVEGGWQLQSQDLANILNGMAKLGLQDDEAVARLLCWVCALDISAWQAAGIAQVCNALTRLRTERGQPLTPLHAADVMDHMLFAALHVPPHTLNPQAVALILHALSLFPSEKVGPMVLPVLLVRLRSFRGRAGKGLRPQSISMTLNALYRLTALSASTSASAAPTSGSYSSAPSSVSPMAAIARRNSHQLVSHLVAQTLQLAANAFSATDLVVLASTFFKGGVRDRRVYQHLAAAVLTLPPHALAAASAPVTSATGMSTSTLFAAQRPHAIGTLLSTFSALGYRSEPLFRAMATATEHVPPKTLSLADVATILNSLARAEDLLDQSARPALQFLAHEMLRLLEPSDSSRRARVAWTDEDSLGSPHAAVGSCLAKVALSLNSLVRLDFLDLATFLRVSEYLRSINPASLSAPVLPAVAAEGGGGGGGNPEGSAGHEAGQDGHGAKLTAHDVALLANAFSCVPDARWLAASSPSLARQARSSYLSRFLSRPSCFQSLSLLLAPTFLPPLLSLPPSLPLSFFPTRQAH